MKKGELSFEVIVGAIIVVLVLVVISYIFLNGIGPPAKELTYCEPKGGSCIPSSEDISHKETCQNQFGQDYRAASWTCEKSDHVCCMKINSFE